MGRASSARGRAQVRGPVRTGRRAARRDPLRLELPQPSHRVRRALLAAAAGRPDRVHQLVRPARVPVRRAPGPASGDGTDHAEGAGPVALTDDGARYGDLYLPPGRDEVWAVREVHPAPAEPGSRVTPAATWWPCRWTAGRSGSSPPPSTS
ncbi:hypothetical protein ACFQX6_00875 [Streptosporangium lutulentum]